MKPALSPASWDKLSAHPFLEAYLADARGCSGGVRPRNGPPIAFPTAGRGYAEIFSYRDVWGGAGYDARLCGDRCKNSTADQYPRGANRKAEPPPCLDCRIPSLGWQGVCLGVWTVGSSASRACGLGCAAMAASAMTGMFSSRATGGNEFLSFVEGAGAILRSSEQPRFPRAEVTFINRHLADLLRPSFKCSLENGASEDWICAWSAGAQCGCRFIHLKVTRIGLAENVLFSRIATPDNGGQRSLNQ